MAVAGTVAGSGAGTVAGAVAGTVAAAVAGVVTGTVAGTVTGLGTGALRPPPETAAANVGSALRSPHGASCQGSLRSSAGLASGPGVESARCAGGQAGEHGHADVRAAGP